MMAFEHALILLLLIASLSVVARWLPWPPLITYLLGGMGAALVPAFPQLKLEPGFFFLCFLPPLLFADGWLMPLREFLRARRAILTLAIGLVIFTTITVGLVAWWLVPGLPLAMAFALGAIVSPTDAVAVNAITERLRVPTRLTTVLNGESLMNDATGLVAFKFALAAAVAFALVLPRLVNRGATTSQPATPVAHVTAPASPVDELSQLHRRSQSLERWIAAVAARAPQDGRDLMAAVEVEDLIGLVDVQLGGAHTRSDALPLWRQRVALLEDLAAIRGNGVALAANGADGEAVPASLNLLN